MLEAALFCEDSFHERFVLAMLGRFSRERGVAIRTRAFSARGGLPKMHGEFKDFLRDLERDRQPIPDLALVVADANCRGVHGRKSQLDKAFSNYPQFRDLFVHAIPDPHIERWMLVDAHAFQTVFGKGCTLPALKCEKGEYKRLLRSAMKDCGIDAPLGGEEYAEDIVNAMDLAAAELKEPSLGLFLKALKRWFNSKSS